MHYLSIKIKYLCRTQVSNVFQKEIPFHFQGLARQLHSHTECNTYRISFYNLLSKMDNIQYQTNVLVRFKNNSWVLHWSAEQEQIFLHDHTFELWTFFFFLGYQGGKYSFFKNSKWALSKYRNICQVSFWIND